MGPGTSRRPPSLPAGPGAAGLCHGAGLQGLARGLQGAEEPPGNDGGFAFHENASPLAKRGLLREQQRSPSDLGFHVGCAPPGFIRALPPAAPSPRPANCAWKTAAPLRIQVTLLPFLATSEEPIAARHPCAQQCLPYAEAKRGGAKGWPLLAPVSDRNPNHQKHLGI